MQSKTAHSARALRSRGALAVLRYVHAHPSATRADTSRALGLSSGSATEITSRLKASRLIDEDIPPRTGGRGRPSPRSRRTRTARWCAWSTSATRHGGWRPSSWAAAS